MLGWELPPYNSGGLGVACQQMCQALSKKDVAIEFVLPYAAAAPSDFMTITPACPSGVDEIMATLTGAYDSHKYVFSDGHEEWLDGFSQQQLYELAVERLAKSREFDIIHAHDWLTFRAGLRAKQVSGQPLIVHVHSIEADRCGQIGGGNPLVREIESLGLLMADQIVAVSQHTKDAIVREYAIPETKIKVVHNGIDRAAMAPLDASNSYQYLTAMKNQGYQIVTNVGRLTIQKGLPNLLRAAREVIECRPKTIFLIVGAGEQYYELIDQAANLGIARNVIFTGFQRGKNWRDSFAIADLFVMPSVSEPFGLTPLEALHYGTPSLISHQSGVSEALQNCLKVDFWDIDEMANQIVGVLQSYGLRRELTRNAERELDRFGWDESVDKLLAVYQQHKAGRLAELAA